MYNTLFDHIRKECPAYPEDELNMLFRFIQIGEHSKKTILMHEGCCCKQASFIIKGCFRYFTTTSEGNEVITHFAFEDWWVGDIQSIIFNTPAKFSLEALEDCILLDIPAQDFNYLLHNSPAFADFKQKKRAKAYQSALEQAAIQREPAEVRYTYLLSKFPGISQRIPQYYIASYLGITPESLSRLRKKIACTRIS